MFNRVVFNEIASRFVSNDLNPRFFTYIAAASCDNIYKIGMSRNPGNRDRGLKGYAGHDFKVEFFSRGNIEYDLIHAISRAGAIPVMKSHHPKSRDSEAFYLSKEDIQHIVGFLGFIPIKDFSNYASQKENGNS